MNLRHRRASALSIAAALAALAHPAFAQEAPAGKGQTGQKAALPPASAARKDAAIGKVQGVNPAQSKGVPPRAVVDPDAARKMEALLIRWADQSKLVKSLSVPYDRIDESKLFGEKKIFQGEARLMPDRIGLDSYEVVNGKKSTTIDERIVCDGKNVYQFVGLTKKIWVYPLDGNAEEKALNQGPLPFLFNMTIAKAKQRYDMEYLGDDEKSYAILIRPKLAIDREEFTQAWVKLDKQLFLPSKIKLWSPDGNETKTFAFNPDKMLKNTEIHPGWFDGQGMVEKTIKDKKAGWIVHYNPKPTDPGAGQPPRNAPAPAGAVGSRPAAKGAVRQK